MLISATGGQPLRTSAHASVPSKTGTASTFGVGGNTSADVPAPEGDLYVADSGDNRIQKFGPDGAYLAKFGSIGTADGQFEGPGAVTVDSQGSVYIADVGNSRVQVFALAIVPEIAGAGLNGKKLMIKGRGFGNAPQVMINGVDVSTYVTASSDRSLFLKGNRKKLDLHAGDNIIVITGNANVKSAPFVLTL
jgi:DNA-binding beta-propeller fold protein YncE